MARGFALLLLWVALLTRTAVAQVAWHRMLGQARARLVKQNNTANATVAHNLTRFGSTSTSAHLAAEHPWAGKHCVTSQGLQSGETCAAATSLYKGLEAEHRFAPARAPNWFVTMQPKGLPKLEEAWPSEDKPAGIWLFLVRSDRSTVLMATKEQLADPDVLDLPPTVDASLLEHAAHLDHAAHLLPTRPEAPIQRHLTDTALAAHAEWHIERVDLKESKQIGQVRFLHVFSGRYLSIANFRKTLVNRVHTTPPKEQVPVLTSCAPATCEKYSTEFNLWPRTEYPLSE